MDSRELYHHGIKGQKWGVRRFQNEDGTWTKAGKERYGSEGDRKPSNSIKERILAGAGDLSVSSALAINDRYTRGKNIVDSYLAKGTSFSRIQVSDKFENFAFYATYQQQDIDKYTGLFGRNLRSRAHDKELPVYKLRIEAKGKVTIPSDANAAKVMSDLLKDSDFKEDLIKSIEDSKNNMRRPIQQILFKDAQRVLSKGTDNMTDKDRMALYKAFNLSLTFHNDFENRTQDRFYSALKKNGYSALIDLNDQLFSSYHAKDPVIIFDLDKVKLQSVSNVTNKEIDSLYNRVNLDRVVKDIPANTIGLLMDYGNVSLNKANDYTNNRVSRYLGGQ